MKGYIITGTSSGIGKALCELLLEDQNNYVVGISRNQNIHHPNYQHFKFDLNDVGEIGSLNLPDWQDADQISLIHNAGWVGPIQKLGRQELGAIAATYLINLVAPAVLSNHFINKYQSYNAQKVILSVGSGASKVPISGWNTYCSSKAGLEMLSQCVAQEHEDIISLCIAPGKVDTAMQEDIRFAEEDEFPRVSEFRNYYENGELLSTKEVANKYKEILSAPTKYLDVKRISEI